MLELNIYQNQNSNNAETYGKYYARVENKKQMSIHDMAVHMAKHSTPFTAGTIEGILTDFVNCTREQCLEGKTVKVDNLAIFKCSVKGNGMTLNAGYKVNAGLGSLPATKNADGSARTPDYTKETQYAVGTVRLQALATGEFTRSELNNDAQFRWTKAARQLIDTLINPAGTSGSNTGSNTGGGTGGNAGGGDDTPGVNEP